MAPHQLSISILQLNIADVLDTNQKAQVCVKNTDAIILANHSHEPYGGYGKEYDETDNCHDPRHVQYKQPLGKLQTVF